MHKFPAFGISPMISRTVHKLSLPSFGIGLMISCALHIHKLSFPAIGHWSHFFSAVHWLLLLASGIAIMIYQLRFPCLALLTRFCFQFWFVHCVCLLWLVRWNNHVLGFTAFICPRIHYLFSFFQLPRAGTGDSWRTSYAWKSTEHKKDLKDNQASKGKG